MAVYTHLDKADFESILQQYDVGTFESFEPIRQGVENTNYHVFTTQGRYILTIFEKRVNAADLPFFFAFTSYLTDNGIVCPSALKDRDGKILNILNNKHYALISWLPGTDVATKDITPQLCEQLGRLVARMHRAACGFNQSRPNDLNVAGWKALAEKIGPLANNVADGLEMKIAQDLKKIQRDWPANLPSGVVHADIFPDNVFIKDDRIYGVIDFYFSCRDAFIYDLALVVNAWCFDENHHWVQQRWDSLYEGYKSIRPLNRDEKDSFQLIASGAAMRILMTRLHDWVFHDDAALVTPKDPKEYIKKLDFHRDHNLFA